MKINYISPHFDDAIGSCGGKIYHDVQNDKVVSIITIFSKVSGPFSDYADSLHKYWNLKDPYNDRKLENINACKSLGVRNIDLGFEDAIYRRNNNIYLYPLDGDIFKKISIYDREMIDKIYEQMKEKFNINDKYYFPMAIGNHVDHQIAHIVGKRMKEDGYNIIFYRDFSYEDKHLDNVEVAKKFVLSEDEILAKVNAVEKYKSQISMIFESKNNIYNYYKNKLNGEEIYYE